MLPVQSIDFITINVSKRKYPSGSSCIKDGEGDKGRDSKTVGSDGLPPHSFLQFAVWFYIIYISHCKTSKCSPEHLTWSPKEVPEISMQVRQHRSKQQHC